MSSLKDKKSNFWNNTLDTHPIIDMDEAAVDRLLINTDFDISTLPDITARQHFFANDEQLVDINTADDFHDSKLFVGEIIEKTPTIIAEPIATVEDVNAPITLHITLKPKASTLYTDNDKYTKSAVYPPGKQEPTVSGEITPSLVENHTKVQKNTPSNDFIFDSFSNNTPIAQAEKTAPQPQRSDLGKRIQTPLIIMPSTHESVHDPEWALFKAEQEKIHAQFKKRIVQLEKSIRTAVLISILAGILAGVSLIAAVSGLV
jgi:hypothetical protein